MGHRRALEQRGHRRKRTGSGDPARSGPPQLRGQRVQTSRAVAGLHQEMGRRQEAGQDRLHVVDGRPVHARGLGRVRLHEARTRIDRGSHRTGGGGLRHQSPDDQPRRLPHRLQRDDGGHRVPLAGRLRSTSRSAARSARRSTACSRRRRGISIRRR